MTRESLELLAYLEARAAEGGDLAADYEILAARLEIASPDRLPRVILETRRELAALERSEP